MLILAIETSCDEASVAVVRDGEVLAVKTLTQQIHSRYGGVVPELAGRSHVELIDPLLKETLSQTQLDFQSVDLIAATVGPGLIGSLLVGSGYARGLARALDRPFLGIHHLEAHLWSAEIDRPEIPRPFLVFLASGGHTMLVLVKHLRYYEVIGSTRDDALGEAYDKVGKLLGLPYPAGAEIDRLAKTGNTSAFEFPRAMAGQGYDFSFSGLKTAVLYQLKKMNSSQISDTLPDILASFQEAALGSVLDKIRQAIQTYQPRALVAAGGVAANSRLRELLTAAAENRGIPCFLPTPEVCGDNAAMIGYLAWKLNQAGLARAADDAVRPRWPLEILSPLVSAA